MADILCREDQIIPPDNFDFSVVTVSKKKIYILANGKPAKYIDIIGSDAFVTPSNSDETELSSDESVSSRASSNYVLSTSKPAATSPKASSVSSKTSSVTSKTSSVTSKTSSVTSKTSSVTSKTSSVTSSEKSRIKVEILLSDSPKSKPKDKQKKLHKRSSPSRRKHSVVDYSASSDEEEEDYKRRVKKETKKKVDHRPIKYEEPEEIEWKHNPNMTEAFGNFHCHICDIVVYSQITFETHIRGKKHLKMVKAKAIPEIAKKSLTEPQLPLDPNSSSFRQSSRISLNEESLIQQIADEYRDGPLPFLSEVVEIRPFQEGYKDIAYLCKLCDANCQPSAIMKHLTGFRHYLKCFEIIDPHRYKSFSFLNKRAIEYKVENILLDYERRYGRGRIVVQKEIFATLVSQPGCSKWKDEREQLPALPSSSDNPDTKEQYSDMNCLDTRMNDFFCTVCDAHMNNTAMWEAHVRGKRHIKNVKKIPGENSSKIKAVQCPDETAHLMDLLDEQDDGTVIVGLDYIRETQGENGDLYNCYLCGACASPYDIRDHLISIKHMTKYLETLHQNGQTNAIEDIKALIDISKNYRECLVMDECRRSVKKYGMGKVVVYRSKNMF